MKNPNNTVTSQRRRFSALQHTGGLLCLLLTLLAAPAHALVADKNSGTTPAAGHITLLIGDARIQGPQRKNSATLQNGSPVYPGDIITTRASGHVHLRFIDGAMMSVRPSSRLTIEAYNYDPQNPENHRVHFKLEEGTARSISGQAAKEARERYRMNTPVAAIGVRGTDFIVHTSAERTRALVTEGGIILTGLDDATGMELRGGSQHLLEMDLLSSQPRLMRQAMDEALTSTALHNNVALVQVQASQETLLAERQNGSADKDTSANTEKSNHQPLAQPTDNNSRAETSITLAQATQEPRPAIDINTSEATEPTKESSLPQENINPADLLLTQPTPMPSLIWGHLGTNNDELPEHVLAATAQKGLDASHHKTPVANSAYALYRRNEVRQEINPFLPELEFALRDVSAWVSWHNYREPMSVGEGALLRIDFNRGVFSTQLQLSHERTGQVFFNVSGKAEADGYFSGQRDSQQLQGAASLTATEAAYLFRDDLPRAEESIDGITLWDIKK